MCPDDDDSLSDPRHSTPKLRGTLNLPLPIHSPYPLRSRSSTPKPQQIKMNAPDTEELYSLRLEVSSLRSEIAALRQRYEGQSPAIVSDAHIAAHSRTFHPTSRSRARPRSPSGVRPTSRFTANLADGIAARPTSGFAVDYGAGYQFCPKIE